MGFSKFRWPGDRSNRWGQSTFGLASYNFVDTTQLLVCEIKARSFGLAEVLDSAGSQAQKT
jgi:hypothetical protein